jgi:hypothetical protein
MSLALAAALVTVGCGGGPHDVTAEELVSEGDEICRLGKQRFEEIQEQPLTNSAEGVEQTEQLIEESEDELNALRDLEPPDELREPYDRYLEARGRALEFFRRGRDAAEEQDSEAYIQAQNAVAESAAERRDLARAIGFEECSPSAP